RGGRGRRGRHPARRDDERVDRCNCQPRGGLRARAPAGRVAAAQGRRRSAGDGAVEPHALHRLGARGTRQRDVRVAPVRRVVQRSQNFRFDFQRAFVGRDGELLRPRLRLLGPRRDRSRARGPARGGCVAQGHAALVRRATPGKPDPHAERARLAPPRRVIRSLGGRVRRAAVLRLVAIAALATLPRALHAQAPAPDDSVFTRAKALVQAGNAAAGRLLVDSILATRSPDSLSYADALFWRASLAASNVDAARDYGRIIVDYPLSPRSADALLQLAQIEQVQSDNDRAAEHLHRFLLENPDHPERGRASYMLAELLLARNDMP